MKISPCLSKLQLAKVGAFFRHTVEFYTMYVYVGIAVVFFSGQRIACHLFHQVVPCHVLLNPCHTRGTYLIPVIHTVCVSLSLFSWFC